MKNMMFRTVSMIALLSMAATQAQAQNVPDVPSDGFAIAVDGNPVSESGVILETSLQTTQASRDQDVALSRHDVAVKFDGFGVEPRLTLGADAGAVVTFRNQMNYPAFATRGELRIIDQSGTGGGQAVRVLPMDPNGTLQFAAPEGDHVYVYRVYDQHGRYDETVPVSLEALQSRQLSEGHEAGTDTTATSRIPVFGGAVTVSGATRGGATVSTLGEAIQAAPSGRFALQRILPPGDHAVTVDIPWQDRLVRDIYIPSTDLFYVGIVDVTAGLRIQDQSADATGLPYDRTFTRGRVAFYLKGKVKGDYLITAALDTGEEELRDLFGNLGDRSPRSLLDRIDPDEFYPVYGDDSTSVNDAPTAGKLYVRIDQGDSHVLWGTFKSSINETEFLRQDRTLYGAQAVYRSPDQTRSGDPKVEAQSYAAQPDTLPQRDVFLGTGGSTYFLKFQDITRGSETLAIEIIDPDTGRVLQRQSLVYGVDYEINYLQGLVTLKSPLSGNAASAGLVVSNPNGDNQAFLVAAYEHTPTAADLDSFSYGGRGQVWMNNELRAGVTASKEDLGTSQYNAWGVDVLYRRSERTFVELEYAATDGASLGQGNSVDGGLTLNNSAGSAGSGRALRFSGQVDLSEISPTQEGVIGGYFEDRTAGFSTFRYQTTHDETLWGLYGDVVLTENLDLAFNYDTFRDGTGRRDKDADLTLTYAHNDVLTFEGGLNFIDQTRPGLPGETGSRLDGALRGTYQAGSDLSVWGFVQSTLKRAGGLPENNRYGVGAEAGFAEHWSVTGEVSDGTAGIGGKALVSYQPTENSQTYFGYTLDPDRDFGGVALNGTDRGSFVLGSRQRVNDRLSYFGESTYDLFGAHRSLLSSYGVEYSVNESLTLDGALEIGRINDPHVNTDFDRRALSFGATQRGEQLSWRGRLEFRQDEGLTVGTSKDAETFAGLFDLRYQLSDDARLLFAVEGVYSNNADASIPNAEYAEATLGYAYRPVDNERINALAKYQFVHDMTERVAGAVSGANFVASPRQEAHIFSVDVDYDINEQWTIGGKVGGRLSRQDSGAGFTSNNATLGVINLRYHAVHNWDALFEVRQLNAEDLGSDLGVLGAVYRHIGDNMKIGIGYNAGQFSDDLADVTYNDSGVFINFVGKF